MPERPRSGSSRDHAQAPVAAEDKYWLLFLASSCSLLRSAGPSSECDWPHHGQFRTGTRILPGHRQVGQPAVLAHPSGDLWRPSLIRHHASVSDPQTEGRARRAVGRQVQRRRGRCAGAVVRTGASCSALPGAPPRLPTLPRLSKAERGLSDRAWARGTEERGTRGSSSWGLGTSAGTGSERQRVRPADSNGVGLEQPVSHVERFGLL